MLGRNRRYENRFVRWVIARPKCEQSKAYIPVSRSLVPVYVWTHSPTSACFQVTEVETSIRATASKQTDTKSRMTWWNQSSVARLPDHAYIKVVRILSLLPRLEAVRRQKRRTLASRLGMFCRPLVERTSSKALNEGEEEDEICEAGKGEEGEYPCVLLSSASTEQSPIHVCGLRLRG